METLAGIVLVGVFVMVYLLWHIGTVVSDLLKEVKGLRFQLQETFTPEDLEQGHYGHPKATHHLVEKILRELQKGNLQ